MEILGFQKVTLPPMLARTKNHHQFDGIITSARVMPRIQLKIIQRPNYVRFCTLATHCNTQIFQLKLIQSYCILTRKNLRNEKETNKKTKNKKSTDKMTYETMYYAQHTYLVVHILHSDRMPEKTQWGKGPEETDSSKNKFTLQIPRSE